jgi:D-3-phosphoglycerate dehydrogenase
MTEESGRPVVVIADSLAPSAEQVLSGEVTVRHVDGTDRPALLEALREANAVIVRSATRMDAEAIAAAPHLTVIARAGVGLDNVDIPAATARGVLVVNAPQSNVVSAAEHAVALLLAVARRIPAADASLRAGQWRRSAFTGVELAGKTIGVVGLGRVGQLFAARMAAFDTTVIAYDPYLQPARAAALGVGLVDLPALLQRSDVISIHLPRTPETVGLIGAEQLATVRPGVLVINAARGGLIDEAALAAALADGRVGGAGIDVFGDEPPGAGHPLIGLPGVVATPHLGASTAEAQDKAGVSVARSVLRALRGEFVPDAVNIGASGPIDERVQPWIGLTSRLGEILTGLAGAVPAEVVVTVRGDLAETDTSVLQIAALRGLIGPVVDEAVSFVNATALAADQGIEVTASSTGEIGDYRSVVQLHAAMPDGESVSVSGTLSGERQVPKLVEINGRHFDLRAFGHLLIASYPDRPGVMGSVGTLLGEAGVNILAAQISQELSGEAAVMVLRTDGPPPSDLLARIGSSVSARTVRAIAAG